MNLLNLYTGPYSEAAIATAQRISRSHDYVLGGDMEAAYKLMRKFHDRMQPFDDSDIWTLHNGGKVWNDPEDIYTIGWTTVDDDGDCELRDAAKVYLHFKLLSDSSIQLPLLLGGD